MQLDDSLTAPRGAARAQGVVVIAPHRGSHVVHAGRAKYGPSPMRCSCVMQPSEQAVRRYIDAWFEPDDGRIAVIYAFAGQLPES